MTNYLGHVPYKIHHQNIIKSGLHLKTFAVVRNPWDRFVSAYEYAKLKNSFWHNDLNPNPLSKIACSCSFEQFVKYFYNIRDKLNIINEPLYHINSQYIWIVDDTNTIRVDYIIKYENLENELSTIGLNAELQNINKSSHTSYQSDYTNETKELVANMYAIDIQLFKYQF